MAEVNPPATWTGILEPVGKYVREESSGGTVRVAVPPSPNSTKGTLALDALSPHYADVDIVVARGGAPGRWTGASLAWRHKDGVTATHEWSPWWVRATAERLDVFDVEPFSSAVVGRPIAAGDGALLAPAIYVPSGSTVPVVVCVRKHPDGTASTPTVTVASLRDGISGPFPPPALAYDGRRVWCVWCDRVDPASTKRWQWWAAASDDNGATWGDASPISDPFDVTVSGDSVPDVALAVAPNGSMLLFAVVVDSVQPTRRIRQWSGRGWLTEVTTTQQPWLTSAVDVRWVDGYWIMVRIGAQAATGPSGGTQNVFSLRLPSSSTHWRDVSGETDLGINAGAVDGVGDPTGDDLAFGLVVADAGRLVVVTGDAAQVVYSDDGGITWVDSGYSAKDFFRLGWDHEGSRGRIAWVPGAGIARIGHWETAYGPENVGCEWLGGWSTVPLGDDPTAQEAWQIGWICDDIPSTPDWAVTSSGAPTWSAADQGLRLSCDSSSSYYAVASDASAAPTTVVGDVRVKVESGDTLAARNYLRLRLETATGTLYHLDLRFGAGAGGATDWVVRDLVDGADLASGTLSTTSGDYAHMRLVVDDDGSWRLYGRVDSGDRWDGALSSLGNGTAKDGAGSTDLARWEWGCHDGDGTATWYHVWGWRSTSSAANRNRAATDATTIPRKGVAANGDPSGICGALVRAASGVGVAGDAYDWWQEYADGPDKAVVDLYPSPSVSAQDWSVIVLDPYGDDGANPGALFSWPLFGVYIRLADPISSWPNATISVRDTSGSWVTVAEPDFLIDYGSGVDTPARTHQAWRPGSNGANNVVVGPDEARHMACSFDPDATRFSAISPGLSSAAPTATFYTKVPIDSSSLAWFLLSDQLVLILDGTTIPDFDLVKVQVSGANIAVVAVGPVWPAPDPPDWGRTVEVTPGSDLVDLGDGRRVVDLTQVGPRRAVEMHWTGGVDETGSYDPLEMRWWRQTPDGRLVAIQGTTPRWLAGIVQRRRGKPVVLIEGAQSGVSSQTLLRQHQMLYGRLVSPATAESVQGDVGDNEVWRVSAIRVEEEL